ncbi:MBL fold metallo-hydrolase [Brasilonema octagenarum]|uniref:MBL fold metallo-hydrolase n=1 Tax=Brasilonema octagenarum UFV-OR1 TaxID=417115 RepID=A0ABX1M4H3_9CYAN|nr:MBL fold metallo-hydrolase [Brasilonema octagenarum]NMF63407.1 MBL fold metallo-hydrolase [Brasilonema octagenarum UFV-OR1]
MSDRLSVSFRFDAGETASELECLPFGVHHDDEGVCLLIRMGPHRILLDCGLADISTLVNRFQKSAPRGSSPLPADFVLVSHAHPDHARGLLALHKAFPLLPIYASEVTSKLLSLNWQEQAPQEVPSFCQALPLRSPVEFKDGLVAEIIPAGHLPGAVAILLTYTTKERSYRLLYTGDFFLSNSRLVEGLRLEELRGIELDVLIIEGSYGTSRHPHRRTQENQLAERINRAIAERCSVLLPTPTLGLGQELLMLLRSHHHFTGRDLDIWVDRSVAVGCDAYLELLSHLPPSVQNFARHQPLFWDERIRPRVRRMQPQQIPDLSSPCIILTDSTADLSEYCQKGTGYWLTLVPEKTNIKIHDQYSRLMTVETYLLAQHSDGPGTTKLIHNLRPQHVIFVHGSPTYLADLTSLEELQNRYHLHSPAAGTLVELPIGETFLQPAAPETNYEGELTELGTVVTITLPDAITADPRWRHFADTGLIEARWQGEDLVLRGLSQRELLNQNSDRFTWSDLECCGTCRHQRGQRCWNPASPLYNFKVTLEGYCPAFERNIEKSPES